VKQIVIILSAVGGFGTGIAVMIVVCSLVSPKTDNSFLIGMIGGMGLVLGALLTAREFDKKGS
jgi:hypothetical protein